MLDNMLEQAASNAMTIGPTSLRDVGADDCLRLREHERSGPQHFRKRSG